jgi:acyl dehydratase
MEHERSTFTPDSGPRGGVSGWITITQAMIDQFGVITLDSDPLHVDPVWARQHSPFGGTIAFGFLTISLLTHMVHSALGSSKSRSGPDWVYVNYGFDRLRLVAPVPSGSRIRGHFSELAREQDEKGRWRITFDCRIEIDGSERPALVGHWLSLCLPPNG